MKILIYLIAIAVVVGGAVLLLGGSPISESPARDYSRVISDSGEMFSDEGIPAEEEGAPFPATSLYNARGFLDCSYFWNDVRAACPEVRNTKWNSSDPWDINAGPFACKMKALGSREGEFLVNVSRSESAAAAESVFNQAKAGFATIGYKTIDVTGLGEKAYTVPDPYSDAQTGYNFNVKKGVWHVDINSSNTAFCITEERTRDVVQRILRKLP